jgi:hypothetical protein
MMEEIDMAGNINDIMNLYQQFKSNPMGMLSQRFNIPQNINNPNDIVQHLLNTGQITQSQLNNVMNMRNSPMIQQLINK